MKGTIKKEKLNGELLQIRQTHRKIGKITKGESEASQISAFFEKFRGTQSLNNATALEIFHALRQRDSIQAVSSGTALLFVAPQYVKLNLGKIQHSGKR